MYAFPTILIAEVPVKTLQAVVLRYIKLSSPKLPLSIRSMFPRFFERRVAEIFLH
jgi:hypothetical protein